MSKKVMPTPFWQGQSFEIQTEDKKIFYTQFAGEKNGELYIQRPQDKKNMYMNILRGVPVVVFFFDIEEEGLFTFKTNIYILPDGIAYLEKPDPEQIEKAQRRRFFRVKIGVPMTLELPDQKTSSNTIELFTHNISGGGVAFLHPKKITETGDKVSGILQLKTPNFQSDVRFDAKVISIVKTEHDVFRIALEFLKMKEPERADIIKFCMFKQVELRNKLKNDRM
ncbi:PilZ domain-containing protein [Aciduricibacillus chroicocephali]|uniref:PilZ domain-containing protein n=1 Tax=Aciduricibacillus chroicocephali TaxID=3054939 RepID=A0ABY9KY59_9BACI|nr:PilZ domain-containing protein [Bacillaceae bacterium 44XB]